MVLRARRRVGAFAWLLASTALGCGGSGGAADAGDAVGPDGSTVSPLEIPWLDLGVPPIAIAPCPEGWREVDDGSGVTTCDPYPEDGALECPAGQAHFPGEPGCTPLGAPCPAGDFSETLPADRNVVYVQPGGTGDGSSPASPYGGFTDFGLGGLPTGTVVALSRGTHPGPVRLARGVALWGACAGETILTTTLPGITDAVVEFQASTGELHDLSVADSPRIGVLSVGDGAEGLLEGVIVDGAAGLGVMVVNGGQLTIDGAVLRGTRSRATDSRYGRGLSVERGSTADVTRTIVEENRDIGVFVGSDGTAVTFTDVVVRDTLAQEADSTGGRGLGLEIGATVELTRALFDHNREIGILAGGAGAAMTLTDVVVRGTESQDLDGTNGVGVAATLGATVHARRTLLDGNREAALFADGAGTTVRLTDVVVRDTLGRDSGGTGGRGFSLFDGVEAEVTRVLFERNREAGVVASGVDTRLTVADVSIRDTRSTDGDGSRGRGLGVQRNARADVTRTLVEGSHEMGVFLGSPGSFATLTDVVIRDTQAADCAETTCPDTPAGHGVGSYYAATLSMTRFLIARSEVCGAHLAQEGQIDLEDGEVREQPIGICLQVPGYDLGRLMTDVRFVDNEVNLDATELPVPEAAEAIPIMP